MVRDDRPIVALTIGDAAGIGPEVIVKALHAAEVYAACRPVVVGAAAVLAAVIKQLGSPLRLRAVAAPEEAAGTPGSVDVIDMANLSPADVTVGRVCPACGKAAMAYIAAAAGLALAGRVGALVTAPINKEAIQQAGYADTGHLEYLARLSGAAAYATMLVSGPLRTVHLTTHYSLAEAVKMVTRDRILARLRLAQASFQGWGLAAPRLAEAALNPHGGEGGLFGNEEAEQIVPAVVEAQRLGIDARGPFPADTVFNRAIAGEFDAVLALYHDQGHIPIKVYGFEQSLSVALGLPFVRTSVDHGTAFDIAGKGVADERSMVAAVMTACGLAAGRGFG